MKRLKSLDVLLLIFVFVIGFSFYSCSDENTKEEQNTISVEQYRTQAKDILGKYEEILNHKANFRSQDDFPTELTQETLDYYASIAGYAPGTVDINLANQVLEKIGITVDKGYWVVVDQTLFSTYTKETLKIIHTKTLDAIISDPDFNTAPDNEKDLLLLSIALLEELGLEDDYSSYRRCTLALVDNTTGDINDVGASCWVVGGIIGGAVGAGICGPPCAGVGALIGIVIGGWLGDK